MTAGRLFDILADRHARIEKAAGALGMAASFVAKRPLQTIGAVLTGQQVMTDSKKMMSMAGRGAASIPHPSVNF